MRDLPRFIKLDEERINVEEIVSYGLAMDEDDLPDDEFERGMISGKLSALHRALGNEWNFLDDSPEKRWTVMRREEKVIEAEEEYFEKIWFGRSAEYVLNERGEEVLVPKYEVGRPALR